MNDDELPLGPFGAVWGSLIIVATFVGLPIAAYLLWDDHRTLAWIALLAIFLGFFDALGFGVAAGFIAYALTENAWIALLAVVAALAIQFGPFLLADLLDRGKDSDEGLAEGDYSWNGSSIHRQHYGESNLSQVPPGASETQSLPVANRYCGQCGTPVAVEARYCESCGHQLTPYRRTEAIAPAVPVRSTLAVTQNPGPPSSSVPLSGRQRAFSLRRFWSLQGRIGRKDFMIISVVWWLALLPIRAGSTWARTDSCSPSPARRLFSEASCSSLELNVDRFKFPVFVVLLVVIWVWIGWAAMVKRSHDFGWSGWVAILLSVIPLVALIFYLMLFLRSGDTGTNRFGAADSGSPWRLAVR